VFYDGRVADFLYARSNSFLQSGLLVFRLSNRVKGKILLAAKILVKKII